MMTPSSSFDSTIHSLYLAFYGRPADPAGLTFWSRQLAEAKGDQSAIIDAFAASNEANVRFAAESTEQRIADIYAQLFNRAPDTTGLAFWLDAVESGRASMADVAHAILKGAQGSDHTLVELRQQAMTRFTEQVQASGSSYSGFASVEAARVLVRGVTLAADANDIDALVKAAVSFADTATRTPAVVDAIATGGTLQALYDTARGNADPVALTRTLADTAKAAAGNPDTLDSLLRGGGMAKVLEVMPADASLKDVVAALAAGGLSAAVEVVYPSAPPAPTFGLKLAFSGVTQGAEDIQVDNITNVGSADVAFSYTGSDLTANQHFEYSLDGVTWIKDGIEVSAAGRTVTIKGVDLTLGSAAAGGQPELLTTVSLRAVDNGGETTAPVSQQIVYDHVVATPRIILTNDTAGPRVGSDADLVTRDGSFTVAGIEPGARVKYFLDGVESDTAPVLQEGTHKLAVWQIDAAGNISAASHVKIVVDTQAPAAPSIALVSDSGIAGDGLTRVGKIAIQGLDTDIRTAWEYSVDGGASWTQGAANDGSGLATLDLTGRGDGAKDVQVRQVDAAGNVGAASKHLSFTLDAGAPAFGLQLAFVGVSEAPNDFHHDNVTNVANANVLFTYTGTDLNSGQHFEYSLDGVNWRQDGVVTLASQKMVGVQGIDLSAGRPDGAAAGQPNLVTTVYLRAADADGAATAPASQQIVYDAYVPTPRVSLVNDTVGRYVGSHHDMLSKDGNFRVEGLEAGATLEYRVDTVMTPSWIPGAETGGNLPPLPPPMVIPGTTWSTVAPTVSEGLNSFAVRQVDAAGNVSGIEQVAFTVDTLAPVAPTIALVTDSGVAGDDITALGKVAITGLEANTASAWEYSADGGETWTFGATNDGSGKAELDLTGKGDGMKGVLVRQIDAAGNESIVSNQIAFTLDTSAPASAIDFMYVEQPHMLNNALTSLSSADVFFKYKGEAAAGDLFQYRLDGGNWTTLDARAYDSATGLFSVAKVDLSQADRKVEVRAVDKAGNEGLSAAMLVESTVNDAPPAEKSTMIYVNPNMYTSAPMLFLTASPYGITTASDKATLSLQNMNFGTPVLPPDNYFDGSTFSVSGGAMSLDAMPRLGFYQLSWTDDSFRTTGPSGQGYVAAGSALFVAGGAGTTTVKGFMVQNMVMITGDVNESNGHASNTAYVGVPNVNARIHTGGGMDLVSDNNGKLTIVYDSFDSSAQDVILGFDAGNDVIELNGAAALAADDNGNGLLEWAAAASSKLLVGSNVEAVRINTSGILSTSPVSYEAAKTVATLNAAIDVSGLRVGDDLLLLAGTSDHNALIWYQEQNGNGVIDAGELSFIAVAGTGAIGMLDIQLVGSAPAQP